jgi:hypothetical protein
MTFLHWEKATAAGVAFFVFELGGAIICSLVFCLAEHVQNLFWYTVLDQKVLAPFARCVILIQK